MDSWSNEPPATFHALTDGHGPGTDVLPRPANSDAEVSDPHVTSVGSVAGLRAMRRRMAGWLEELGVDLPLFVADVQLATVEIVTNAFVHSDAASVDVSLEIVGDDVVATIEHSSSIPTPNVPTSGLPGDDSVTGRGLCVVDQIVRARTVSHSGATSTVRLDIPIPRAESPGQ